LTYGAAAAAAGSKSSLKGRSRWSATGA